MKISFGIRGDGSFLKARQGAKKGELDEQLREYINEWRKQRAKEEDELKRLKEKQAKRKEIRAEQEKKLAQQKVNKQLTFANKLLKIVDFVRNILYLPEPQNPDIFVVTFHAEFFSVQKNHFFYLNV